MDETQVTAVSFGPRSQGGAFFALVI